MDITVFLGAPGSGKGTQAKRLSQQHGFRHFSTGDMLRSAIQSGSELGKKAKKYIDAGDLVPDGVMIELIEDALSTLPSSSKVILDGFPRTVPQAEALDVNSRTAVDNALYFNVDQPLLIRRLTGRRICEKCGEPYHVIFLPPKTTDTCGQCGGRLIQRTDDSESVVSRRLEIFSEQNDQLLGYYRARKKLKELNADKPVDVLQHDLLKILS